MFKKIIFIVLVLSNLVLFFSYLINYPLKDLIELILLSIILIISILIYSNNLSLNQKINFYKRKADLMYQKSICDEMTNIYNHSYLINRLKNINGKYSLMMIDIDNFKEINDNYGHQIGDEVIKHVAKKIKATVRKTDIVGRYGGDEFLIIFQDCNKEEAYLVAKKIKKNIELVCNNSGKEKIELTISAGLYTSDNNNFETALNKVDKFLYQAKNNGKNNIVINQKLKGNNSLL